MGKVTGFMEVGRKLPKRRSVSERVHDWQEIYLPWEEKDAREQAGRCMDCGIPFCNNGCPLGNLIPEWNDLVYHGNWEEAIARLHATNNFPEFTGRICPAPCEPACTLTINEDAITIEMIEKAIAERAWKEGWIKPEPPETRTGKKVAVVGSGPAGMAAAQQLNRAGHYVTLFERSEYVGGLLMLGIPDFKLEKHVVQRRVDQMIAEGIEIRTSTNVGEDISTDDLLKEFDAVCLSGGSTVPRDLPIAGRDLDGIHFAMDYLTQQNRRNKGQEFSPEETITAEDKNVVIIGGGDTGADCLGTAHRHGAKQVIQFEILPRPSEERPSVNPWPQWPLTFRASAAHEEGGVRDFNVMTKEFVGENGKVKRLDCVRVEWKPSSNGGRPDMVEVPGSEFSIDADLVLFAMGFLHPQHNGLLDQLGVEYDARGNVKTNTLMMSNVDGVFACGDMQRGQSLVVHAIASGRMCARAMDLWLMGESRLPTVRGYARPVTHLESKEGAPA
ncbi:MAG: glutamate synthase subunit beta [Dehalococcoidia bacterium]